MTQENEVAALPAENIDFSSNARTNMLEKYSRFHGKNEFSVWCNSPNLKNTDGFRDIVYQISPYNISCVYKKMFEQYSVYNLRIVDDEGISDDESEFASFVKENVSPTGKQGSHSEPASPRYQIEHVDTSNSCIYSAASGSARCKSSKCQSSTPKQISGWRTCERTHSSGITGYQLLTNEETRDFSKKHGKSATQREPACKTFPNSLRNARAGNTHHMGVCKYERGCRKKSEGERGDETRNHGCSSSMTSLSVSPIKVGRHFKHFRRCISYIDQYREEYTYRKLLSAHHPSQSTAIDALMCSCGNNACPASLATTRCIQRWIPNQSHTLKTQIVTACEKTADSVNSGVPVPNRTPVPKKRPPQCQSKQTRVPPHILASKLDEAQRKGTGFSKEPSNGPQFASSFTVNNYNPVMLNSANQRSASSSPSSVVFSGSYGSIGNQHGPVCSPAPQVRCRRQLNHNVRRVN